MWRYWIMKIYGMEKSGLLEPFLGTCDLGNPGWYPGCVRVSESSNYIWSVPIGGELSGGYLVWVTAIMRVLITIGMGVSFIRLSASIYKIVFDLDGKSLAEEKKKFGKSLASLGFLVLSSLTLGIIMGE